MRFGRSSLRMLAVATSVVVPSAIAVHLGAEAFALGAGAVDPRFWLRHAYLLVPLALALWSFCHAAGIGAARSEMIRRCALVRAQLHHTGAGAAIFAFTAANLVFFGVTQLLEGLPIAAASIGAGLIAAVTGSLLAALVVYFWGRSIVATALAVVVLRPRNRRCNAFVQRLAVDVPRAAASTFSLFVPNRPPPLSSLV